MISIFSVHYKQLFYDGAAHAVVSFNHYTKCVETVAGCSAFPVNIADGASDGPMGGDKEDKTEPTAAVQQFWRFWRLWCLFQLFHVQLHTREQTDSPKSIFFFPQKQLLLSPEQPLTSIGALSELEILLTKLYKCFRKDEQRSEKRYPRPWNLFSLWNWMTKLFKLWFLWILCASSLAPLCKLVGSVIELEMGIKRSGTLLMQQIEYVLFELHHPRSLFRFYLITHC